MRESPFVRSLATGLCLPLLLLLTLSCAGTDTVDDADADDGEVAAQDQSDGSSSDEEARPAIRKIDDIEYPDTLIGLVNKKTGRIELIFANLRNERFVLERRSPPTTWRYIDKRKLPLQASADEKLATNVIMKDIFQKLEGFGFYDHAVEITPDSLGPPMPGAAIVVVRGSRAWRMNQPGQPESPHADAYLRCRIGLIREAQRIPTFQFRQTSAESAFRNPEVPERWRDR